MLLYFRADLAFDGGWLQHLVDLVEPILREECPRQPKPGGVVFGLLGNHLPIELFRLHRGRLFSRLRLFERGVFRRAELIEETAQLRLGLQSLELVDELSMEDDLDRGDGRDAEIGGQFLFVVGVDLGEEHLALALRDELFQQGPQHPARAARRRPEIDQHGPFARRDDHVGLEAVGRDVADPGGSSGCHVEKVPRTRRSAAEQLVDRLRLDDRQRPIFRTGQAGVEVDAQALVDRGGDLGGADGPIAWARRRSCPTSR